MRTLQNIKTLRGIGGFNSWPSKQHKKTETTVLQTTLKTLAGIGGFTGWPNKEQKKGETSVNAYITKH